MYEFEYQKPASLDDVARLLGDEEAKLVAGGGDERGLRCHRRQGPGHAGHAVHRLDGHAGQGLRR